MTPADDLPALPPMPDTAAFLYPIEVGEYARAYALAARAERDERIKELEHRLVLREKAVDHNLQAAQEAERRAEAHEKRVAELEEKLFMIKLQPTVGWLIPPKDSITLLESVVVAWRERAFEVSELIERPKCT